MRNADTGGQAYRLRRIGLAFAACLLVHAGPANAFELFGIKFFERQRDAEAEDVIGDPQHYAVEFEVAGDDEDLAKSLKNASSLWADREKPASGAAGLVVKARGDYRRLLNALYAKARYGGTISITIDAREAAGLAADAAFADPASVRVAVDPGPLFHFGQARILNPAPPPTSRWDVVETPAHAGFRAGEIARSGTILTAERLAVDAWRQQGFAKADAVERRVVAAHEANLVDATITLAPGRRAYYGAVGVEGTQRMDPAFVARQTGLVPGEEYDPDDIADAQERLARLGVFRAVAVKEAETIAPDGSLPIDVVVQERLPRRFGVGGSYSTVDGLGLEAFWLHRNLFGRAERLRLDGKVAGIGETIDPKKFTYRLGATFTKPGVFTPDTDFIASVVGDREVLDAYTRTGVSAETGFTHIFSKELKGRAFLNGGHARFEDAFGTRRFTTAGLLGAMTYDTRDEPADATRGFFAEALVEPFYEFEYGNAAARMTAEGRTYVPFGEEARIVAAGRLKLGMLFGPSIIETPPDKLFFAGGGGSVRGYAYRSIGVETPVGIVGGRSLIEASAELRVRVTDSIGVVGFADAAYVGADSIPEFSEDLKVGVGAGLRYLTGLGPIRLDVAVPLDPGPGDPDVALYVGIGQAF